MEIEQLFEDRKLPEGWTLTTVGNVCSRITDGTHKTPAYTTDGIRFLSTANLTPFKSGFDFGQYERFVSNADHEELVRRSKPQRGDILVSKCGTIGRTKEVDVDYPFSIFVGLALLKPFRNLFATRFLEVFLNSPRMQRQFDELSPGSTRRTLALGGLKSAQIPIPPLVEQERIVERVESLLARTSSIDSHLYRIPAILKRFRQAVLAAACSGLLTEDWRDDDRAEGSRNRVSHEGNLVYDDQDLRELPSGWRWVFLSSLGADPQKTVQTGPFGAQLHRDEFTTAGVPVIAVGNLTGMGFTTDGLYYISEQKAKQLAKYDVQAGDVLFARSGATLGKVCVAPELVKNWRMTGHILRARFDPQLVLPEFAVYSLHGDPAVKSQVFGNIRGATRPGFNTALLETIRLPLPPIPEQYEILFRAKALLKVADSIEERLTAVRKYSDRLTQSILSKAFRGELVPTEAELARREGRDYEPASLLLERIRAERALKNSGKIQRSKRAPARSGTRSRTVMV